MAKLDRLDEDCSSETCSDSLGTTSVGDDYCRILAPQLSGPRLCWQKCSYKSSYCAKLADMKVVKDGCAKETYSTSWWGPSVGSEYCNRIVSQSIKANYDIDKALIK